MRLRSFLTLFFIYVPFSLQATNQDSYQECPRIISQSPYISDMLTYLGMEECIVGVSRYSKRDLPRTGGIQDPDREAIDALMPDVFITSNRTKEKTLKEVIPKETKIIKLQSLNKMTQLEENMKSVVEITNWKGSSEKISSFSKAWRKKVTQVKGNNKKVLLLSSCSGNAYSFGPNSRMYDLFTLAGFNVVETKEKIRHVRSGKEIEHITGLLDKYQPDLLFIFEQRLKKQCQMMKPKVPVSILSFDGEKFLLPTTKILQGLDLLISKNHRWR